MLWKEVQAKGRLMRKLWCVLHLFFPFYILQVTVFSSSSQFFQILKQIEDEDADEEMDMVFEAGLPDDESSAFLLQADETINHVDSSRLNLLDITWDLLFLLPLLVLFHYSCRSLTLPMYNRNSWLLLPFYSESPWDKSSGTRWNKQSWFWVWRIPVYCTIWWK